VCEIFHGIDPNLFYWSRTGEYFKTETETGMYYFVNVCGKEYILQEALSETYKIYGEYPDRQQTILTYCVVGGDTDIGIFADSTKSSDEIEPKDFVYVYGLCTRYISPNTDDDVEIISSPTNRIGWLGIVYQENHYAMGPLDNTAEKYQIAYKNNDDIKTQEGEQLYFTGRIRAGKKTEKVKKYKWTQL